MTLQRAGAHLVLCLIVGCTTAPSSPGDGGARDCFFDGRSVPEGTSIEAYHASTVPVGATCEAETRTCNNGVLSGVAAYASCNVGGPAACLWNGRTIVDGDSVTAFANAIPEAGQSCSAETRVCNDGVLSGSFAYETCSGAPAASCTFNGKAVESGTSVTAYETESAGLMQTCRSETRTCSKGVMDGSFAFPACLQHRVNRLLGGVYGAGALVDDKVYYWHAAPSSFSDAQKAALTASGKLANGVITPALLVPSGATDFSTSTLATCQLGNGAIGCSTGGGNGSTTVVPTGASSVTAGWYAACGVVGTELTCWAHPGATANGYNVATNVPKVVLSDGKITSVSISLTRVCAVVTGGAVKCSYINFSAPEVTFAAAETVIASGASKVELQGFDQLCALVGTDLTCAPRFPGAGYVKPDGSLKTTTTPEVVMTSVADFATFQFTGVSVTCVVKTDTSVVCWGNPTTTPGNELAAFTLLATGAARIGAYYGEIVVVMKDGSVRSTFNSNTLTGPVPLYPVKLE